MTPEVVALFFLNTLFLLFGTIALYLSLQIALYYNRNSTSQTQYSLEKKSYLGATIIKYIFAIKIPLFLFFIFILEDISIILPGAMCGAGVVNATEYGVPLFILKVINLYAFAYWIVLDREDMKRESQPYIKEKFWLFVGLYFLLISEIALEGLMFFSIDIQSVVDCCGVIFSNSDGSYMATFMSSDRWVHLSLFYSAYLLLALGFVLKSKGLMSVMSVIFIFVALFTLISFFGLYIYEQPTHHCPFCFLSHDYNYVGYILYILLFLGTFWGALLGVIGLSARDERRYFNLSFISITLYSLIVSGYLLLYFARNSVLL